MMAFSRDERTLIEDYVRKEWHGCFQCIEGFTQQHELMTHMKTHISGELINLSNLQNFGYIQNFTCNKPLNPIDRHKQLDKSPIFAPIYQKVLSTSEQIVRNPSQKPHQCPICRIRFRYIAVFQQHLNLHKSSELRELPQHSTVVIAPNESETVHTREQFGGISSQGDWSNSVFSNDDGIERFSECTSGSHKCPDFDSNNIVPLNFNGSKGPSGVARVCPIGEPELQNESQALQPVSKLAEKFNKTMYGVADTQSNAGEKLQYSETCVLCDEVFANNQNFRDHMIMHNDYPCENISDALQPRLLTLACKKPTREYAGEHSHQCSVCLKGFKDAKSLKRHMRAHAGKHHRCPICNKGFTRRWDMQRHVRIIHKRESQSSIDQSKKKVSTQIESEKSRPQHEVAEYKSLPAENTRRDQIVGKSFQFLNKMAQKGENALMTKHKVHQFSPGNTETGNGRELCGSIDSHKDGSESVVQNHEEPERFSKCTLGTINPIINSPLKNIGHKGPSEPELPMVCQSDNPHMCPVCKKGFRRKDELNQHIKIHTGEKSHKCPICYKGFSHSDKLHQHIMIHTGQKPHRCSICNESFNSADRLNMHMATHTGEKCHECSIYLKSFTHSEKLHKHMVTHTGEKHDNCSICGMGFTCSDKLHQHMRTHPVENSFMCDNEFRHAEQLQKHMAVQSKERCHECPSCSMTFDNLSSVHRHMVTHTGAKSHQCPVCGKQFSQKSSISTHMLTHTGEKPHKCSVCGRGFSQKSSLKSHMIVHNRKLPYRCRDCGKQFPKNLSLQWHMLSHLEKKPYSCSVCGKQFTQRHYVKMHMLIHSEENPFKCSDCGKQFTQKSDLNKHLATHTGEKPHSCSVCDKQFTQSSHVKTHMLSHTGEKPYSCSVCGKQFTRSTYAKRHMLIHTGEKPFKCSDCGKQFTQKSSLKTHMVVHSKERPHKCLDCDEQFGHKSALKAHLVVHSRENPHKYLDYGQDFGYADNKSHMLTYSKENLHQCSVCDKRFTLPDELQRHMMEHTIVID